MSDLLVIDRPDARVLRIALNRPDKRNPFDTATRDAFYQVLDEALEDETVIEQAVARALKKASQNIWDRRPIVETIVLRL